MLNPERLLGNLLMGGMSRNLRRSGRRGLAWGLMGNKAAIGMGLLGAAIAAFEHFTEKSSPVQSPPSSSYSPPPLPPSSPTSPPPSSHTPPSLPSEESEETIPAPSPPSDETVPPPPPGADTGQYYDGVLLIRAMIAAAHADGQLDEEERARIVDKLNDEEISDGERDFILRELEHPKSVDELLLSVFTPEMGEQVYAVSLLAIELDTDSERQYLSDLAKRLRLDRDTLDKWHRQLGAPEL